MAIAIEELSLRGKTLMVPEMDYVTTRTIVAGIEALLGVKVEILPSGKDSNLDLGKRHSSQRECFPYILTLADTLTHLYNLKEKGVSLENRILIYPQAHGPCRFGQYHKCINLILQKLGFDDIIIVSPTTKDSYTLGGQITREEGKALRVVLWNTIVFGDVFNRMVWRARPYERKPGLVDEIYKASLESLCNSIRENVKDAIDITGQGSSWYRELKRLSASYKPVLAELRKIATDFNEAINPNIPRKPLVEVIGEIFQRMNAYGNQDTVRKLEKAGCEVVVASLGEWVNYTTYMKVYEARERLKRNLLSRSGKLLNKRPQKEILSNLKDYIKYWITMKYQEKRMNIAYYAVSDILDIVPDHTTGHVFSNLRDDYHPKLYGEAILSIAGAKTSFKEGFDGVVSIMPFGCMPGNNVDMVLNYLNKFKELNFPFINLIYDGTAKASRDMEIDLFAQNTRNYKRKKEQRK